MIVKGRVEAFIVTLGTMGVFRSVWLTQNSPAEAPSRWTSLSAVRSADLLRDHRRDPAVPIFVFIAIAVIAKWSCGARASDVMSLPSRQRHFIGTVLGNPGGSGSHFSPPSFQAFCSCPQPSIYVPRLGAATPLGYDVGTRGDRFPVIIRERHLVELRTCLRHRRRCSHSRLHLQHSEPLRLHLTVS